MKVRVSVEQHTADQPRKRRTNFGVGLDAEQRQEQALEHALQFPRSPSGLGPGLGQFGKALPVDRAESPADHRVNQRLLRSEVIMHCREVALGRDDDVAQRHGIEPLLGEKPLGGVEDPCLGVRFWHFIQTTV